MNMVGTPCSAVQRSRATASRVWTGLKCGAGSTIVAADWHFTMGGKFIPFIGVATGATYTEEDIAWSVGPEVGFKYYVHERTFIFLSAEYRWFFDDLESIDNNSDDGSFAFLVGVGFTIGGR